MAGTSNVWGRVRLQNKQGRLLGCETPPRSLPPVSLSEPQVSKLKLRGGLKLWGGLKLRGGRDFRGHLLDDSTPYNLSEPKVSDLELSELKVSNLKLSEPRALPTETKVESGTSQSKSGTSVNLGNS